MDLPQRKNLRLQDYDYSQNGCYFVTLCVKDRCTLLGKIDVGGGLRAAPHIELTEIGKATVQSISFIREQYRSAAIEKFVVMPNHVHLLISLAGGHGNPPLPDIVGRLKSFTAKCWNEIHNTNRDKLWQRGYYEHVVRDESDYLSIWDYIASNPMKWLEDEYYAK